MFLLWPLPEGRWSTFWSSNLMTVSVFLSLGFLFSILDVTFTLSNRLSSVSSLGWCTSRVCSSLIESETNQFRCSCAAAFAACDGCMRCVEFLSLWSMWYEDCARALERLSHSRVSPKRFSPIWVTVWVGFSCAGVSLIFEALAACFVNRKKYPAFPGYPDGRWEFCPTEWLIY